MHNSSSLFKTLISLSTLALCVIAVQLIPVSRQAKVWNSCLNNMKIILNESLDLIGWDLSDKETLAVGICNGAVHEPKLK
tara:strand:+ start:4799 stop:5038 length:240 start_codon:yes stop_codon:yes gene_type:complete